MPVGVAAAFLGRNLDGVFFPGDLVTPGANLPQGLRHLKRANYSTVT